MLHGPSITMLVDTGGWRAAGHKPLLDHLSRDQTARLDALVLTHPDADHVGGCEAVLSTLDVELVLHPGLEKDTRTWQVCTDAIRAEGAPVLTDAEIDPGGYLDIGPHVQLRLVWVDAGAEDVNEGSLVLHLRYGNATAVLTGDIGCDTEDRILARGFDLDVDVLKVAHHGSGASTCDPWLSSTTPRLGVISVAADSPYGHPHPDTLERLRAHDVEVYRSDEDDTITLETDGDRWSVCSHKRSARSASSSGPPGGNVALARIQADAPGDDNENLTQEWVELANPTNRPVDLSGWRLSDEAGHTYRFPDGSTLATNGTLRVHTGSGIDNETDLFWGRQRAVWNNDGDTAYLTDAADVLVDDARYP